MENLWQNNLKNITLKLVKNAKIYKVRPKNVSWWHLTVSFEKLWYFGNCLSLTVVRNSSLWESLTTVVLTSGLVSFWNSFLVSFGSISFPQMVEIDLFGRNWMQMLITDTFDGSARPNATRFWPIWSFSFIFGLLVVCDITVTTYNHRGIWWLSFLKDF